MGLINYAFLAPIILPRIEKDSRAENLKRYTIFFNRKSGEVKQYVFDDTGEKVFNGNIDLRNSWSNPQGKMIHKGIEKECPECTNVLFEIDRESKAVTIAYFDEQNQLIKANKYN